MRPHRAIWTVFLDGIPVSFAYAPWRSARWFDVSVDTLAEARQSIVQFQIAKERAGRGCDGVCRDLVEAE